MENVQSCHMPYYYYMKNIVAVITGPIGSGKSTLSRQLAKKRELCADIDIEVVNHMIVSGFSFNPNAEYDQQITFNEWSTSSNAIGVLAKYFLDSGYDVIIHGRTNEQLLRGVENHIRITHKLLLLPAMDEVIARDSARGSSMSIGESAVRKDYEYYLQETWQNFVRIDTSNESVVQSVSKLQKILFQ
jgi:cytidylate kinase